jgi:NAD(P)-dependent dehydrogenase (short-subunit alcohol dehydrogenase family)
MKNCGGKIVNVSSLAMRRRSKIAGPQYVSAKAAIVGFTKQVAWELGKYGINVNAIAPGLTLSPRAKQRWEGMKEEEKRMLLSEIPLGRLAEVEDQAKVVLFLCSEEASYITGVTIDVNGGTFMP